MIDIDDVEDELELSVPDIYRLFLEAVAGKGLSLKKYGIHDSTQAIVTGNEQRRSSPADGMPKWKDRYFDFGVGDGCGNCFFLIADGRHDDAMKLLSHDPPGVEEVGSATDFFMALLAEIELGFEGPDRNRFQGHGPPG